MWRRVSSLSPFLFSSKSTSLGRAGHGWNACGSLDMDLPFSVHYASSLRDKNPFNTFVLGGPGSGKGTQCEKIAETFGFTHLSAGDLLRKEIHSNSEERNTILDILKDGKIAPSQVTVKLIFKAMESSHSGKFLIDGFPRTEENRVAFERFIRLEPTAALFFDCPE